MTLLTPIHANNGSGVIHFDRAYLWLFCMAVLDVAWSGALQILYLIWNLLRWCAPNFQCMLSKHVLTPSMLISTIYSVRLLWVPRHHRLERNETVHMLAKQATCLNFVGFEPATGLSPTVIRSCVRQWVDKEQCFHRLTTDGCQQA